MMLKRRNLIISETPAEKCQPFVIKQKTPFYHLDNMAVLPIGEKESWMHYGDFRFRQTEILYNMPRMDSVEAHEWLKETKGKIPYSLPDDFHLFGKPILPL